MKSFWGLVAFIGVLVTGFSFFTVHAASSPVLFWRFDEGSGSTAIDSTGNGNTGTLYNSPTHISGDALNFNGTNQYVRSNSAVSGSVGRPNTSYTISAQVRVASGETNGGIIHVSSGADGTGWCIPMLGVYDGKFRALSWQSAIGVTAIDTTNVTTGQWYSVAHVWDSVDDLLKLYVDGELVASTAQSSFDAANADVYIFAGFSTPSCAGDTGYFAGDIRNVKIDANALTEEEIAVLLDPVADSFSPADNATNVAVDTNLVIEFNEDVTIGSGNILIKKTSDDTTVDTIDVTGEEVTGNATTTITINPADDLPGGTDLYVTIPDTAFLTSGGSYAGISATSTWNFTTIETYSNEFSLTGSTAATSTVGVALPITDIQVVGNSASTTPVKLLVSNGTLALGTTTGLTFTGDETGDEIYFSGTVANVNAALATLTYTRGGTGTDTLEVSLVEYGEVFFPGNNHIYMVVNENVTANNARTQAQTYTKYGFQGYLATITSADENNYVKDRLSTAGWIGGSDAASEGVWRWLDGPEAGQQFWSGAAGGSVTNDLYANWNTGEPNDYSTGEDCAQFLSGSTGLWNDLPCNSSTIPFVVEFGDESGEELIASLDVALATVNAPTVASLSPADNATNVAIDSNLTITFSQDVSTSTGNILIKKTSDDTTVETIDVAGASVVRASSTAFTISPSSDFDEQTGYYVIVPSTSFKNSSDAFFAGISATSTWNFITGDFTASMISGVSATSSTATTATVTWTTDESASSRVVYGLTSTYGTTTPETNTSPRVTSHEVGLTGLTGCTLYHYAVVSVDGSSNAATSSDATFITPGCEASETPVSATSTMVTASSGGNTSLTEGRASLGVSAPNNFTSTSSSVVIQVKSVVSSNVLSSIGRPTAKPNTVGTHVFDVKALINNETLLDSFDAPITITYTYDDVDIGTLDESTLWVYHYHNGEWEALDSCEVNTDTNTVTCTTDSFSIFGLFGEEAVTESSSASGSSRSSGSRIQTQVSNLITLGKVEEAEALKQEWYWLFTDTANASASHQTLPVRDLTIGMTGDDVRALQVLLNTHGYVLADTGAGSPGSETSYFGPLTQSAVARYQSDHAVYPTAGYFGPLTRQSMTANNVAGAWWE